MAAEAVADHEKFIPILNIHSFFSRTVHVKQFVMFCEMHQDSHAPNSPTGPSKPELVRVRAPIPERRVQTSRHGKILTLSQLDSTDPWEDSPCLSERLIDVMDVFQDHLHDVLPGVSGQGGLWSGTK